MWGLLYNDILGASLWLGCSLINGYAKELLEAS